MATVGSALSYARDHRTHHKWSDTDVDPENASRGFFYSHIGWWMLKKDAKVIEYGKRLSYDDLWNDDNVRLQHRHYIPLVIVISFIIPTLIPYLLWNEDLLTSFLVCVALRSVVVWHHMWTVNSIAHLFGDHPYDKSLRPTENKLVGYLSMGEGSHNFHHAFPYDYTSSEHSWLEMYNPSAVFIDVAQYLFLAYDVKKASKNAVKGIIDRKGDAAEVSKVNYANMYRYDRLVLGAADWIIGTICVTWTFWSIAILKMLYYGFLYFCISENLRMAHFIMSKLNCF